MSRRLGVPVTALVGLVLVAQGLWIPAKAVLAQVLLQYAWTQTVDAGGPNGTDPAAIHRPWPWADTWPVARLRAPAHDAT